MAEFRYYYSCFSIATDFITLLCIVCKQLFAAGSRLGIDNYAAADGGDNDVDDKLNCDRPDT